MAPIAPEIFAFRRDKGKRGWLSEMKIQFFDELELLYAYMKSYVYIYNVYIYRYKCVYVCICVRVFWLAGGIIPGVTRNAPPMCLEVVKFALVSFHTGGPLSQESG